MNKMLANYYAKTAVAYLILFSLVAIISPLLAALQGGNWEDMSGTAHFCIVLSVLGSFANTMLAFLNQTMARMRQAEPELPQIFDDNGRRPPVIEPTQPAAPADKKTP